MEPALPNAFAGRPDQPTAAELAQALGDTKSIWDTLIATMSEMGVATFEWSSYSIKQGWAARLKRKARTILWLSPNPGCFSATFILGDRAMAAARDGKPSAKLLKLLDGAQRYPEGSGIRIHIKSARDLAVVRRLAEVKLAN